MKLHLPWRRWAIRFETTDREGHPATGFLTNRYWTRRQATTAAARLTARLDATPHVYGLGDFTAARVDRKA